ncbi:MAG: iron-sulfur cluster assembly accessory protein [Acidobacteriota bacterium]|jgi:iron-sulfur cluster assembly protein
MITMTDNAVKAVEDFLESEKKPEYGLRVAVVGGGCSGFQYDLALAEQPAEDDQVFTFGELSVFVDKTSMLYLKGTTIDYISDIRGSGFVFENPNAVSSCGCGHSFQA